MRVIFTPQARAEYVEAVEWYAHLAPGLDKRLREDFGIVRARIVAKPLHFPAVVGGSRRARLEHFPYIVIFRLSGDMVQIIAFFHTSRDPHQWQRRT